MLTATKKQQQLLAFISDYQTRNGGISPTFDEMKKAIGIKNKSGVHVLLTSLEERGAIWRMPNRARAIGIIRQGAGRKQPPFPGAIPIYDARTNEIRSWIA